MASPEAALVAALTGEATVSALVAARVFPVGGRQGVSYPYITFQRISTQGEPHLDGPSNLDHPRFQLNVWGPSLLSARTTADAVRAFLDCEQRTGAGLSFMATFQDERSDYEETTKVFSISQDYFIWHER